MSAYLTQSLMASDRPTAALAQWCSALSQAPLPADVAHQTVRHVLDTLAACAAGMGRPLVQDAIVLERTLNPVAGEVPIFGGPQRWTVLEAASLMAIACHALEMDDGNREGSIHPGTVVVPAVLALGWQRQANYRDLLAAVVAGYEVAVSIAETLHPHASKRGFQTTPVAGVIGAAAACGTLLGLDAAGIESAMGMAASSAGGIFAYLSGGGNIKKFHPGHAAREGVRAALMAHQGSAIGPRGVLESPSGVLQAFAGLTGWDGSAARPRTELAVVRSYLKPYPCCRHIHPAIDAVLALRARNSWDVKDIQSVDIETYGAAMPHASLPWHTLEIAQLSFPWTIALAIVDGAVVLDGFHESAREREELNALAARVKVSQSEECDRLYPKLGPARVTVRLSSGATFTEWVEDPLGSAERPLSDDALDRKALDGLRAGFDATRAENILRQLRTIDDWGLEALA